MDSENFLNVVLRDLCKLSLSLVIKTFANILMSKNNIKSHKHWHVLLLVRTIVILEILS